MSKLPIDAALRDRHLLGAALGDITSWSAWVATLRAAAGLPLNDEQRVIFDAIAGGRAPPTKRVRELWAVVGRGAGKSRTAAAVGVHAALLTEHRLAPGEVGYVLVLSPTVGQAAAVFRYALGFIRASPVLRQEIVDTTRSEIRLRNGIIIATHPNSYRSVRGRTLLAIVFDESAFWRDETSSNPDIETYRAVLPSLVRSGGQLIGISTPYRKLGLLYQKHKDFYGVDDPDTLIVQGGSRVFNPTLDEAAIAKAAADDPEGALAEWEAEFRTDIATFLADADIDAAVDRDRPLELPPRSGLAYRAFTDASGGRHDHFTICIAHGDEDRTIVDVVRGRPPPFDPASVVKEFAALLKEYGLRDVTGDNYSAEWVATAFEAAGVRYQCSEWPKSKLYVEGLPSFTRRLVSLPNHPRLLRELRLLERRTHAGGRDTVDHGRAGSDDYANSAFGVLSVTHRRTKRLLMGLAGADGFGRVLQVDPVTCRPVDEHAPTRIRWLRVSEEDAPAAKGEFRVQTPHRR